MSLRAEVGLLVAPFAAGGVAALSLLPHALFAASGELARLPLAAGLSSALAFVVALLAGVPAHRLLCRLGWTSRLPYALLGLAASLMLAPLVLRLERSGLGEGWQWWLALVNGGLGGPAVGLAFWRVARPDRVVSTPRARRA